MATVSMPMRPPEPAQVKNKESNSPQRESVIAAQQANIENSLRLLAAAVAALHERIKPVMRSLDTTCSQDQPPPDAATGEMVQWMNGISAVIEALRTQLASMLTHLEL